MLLVLWARMVRTWKQAHITCPVRDGSRDGIARDSGCIRKYKFRADSAKPKISVEAVALNKEMASNNRLCGTERIRGELLRLGIRVYLPQTYSVTPTVLLRQTKMLVGHRL